MTSVALASLQQVDDESYRKFKDRFGRTTVQIQNLNPEVALHSILPVLCPSKFADNLCKNSPGSMDELCE